MDRRKTLVPAVFYQRLHFNPKSAGRCWLQAKNSVSINRCGTMQFEETSHNQILIAREMLPCLIIDPIDWEQDLPNLYITEMIMPDEAREMLPCLIIDPIDWEQDLPNLYITEMIMPDEIDLDTDEDRMGTIKEDDKIVKRIDTLGGTPDCLQIVDEAMWAQFLPPAR
ncbi:unnamed protein product [Toxocara canis]|uniref:Uncharacterized protein n=1 Tax=Toxocara canis TaxID=6265 RepID=A0A183UDC3_TOXCA|nr:unnamed protein product [Toxocara canis]